MVSRNFKMMTLLEISILQSSGCGEDWKVLNTLHRVASQVNLNNHVVAFLKESWLRCCDPEKPNDDPERNFLQSLLFRQVAALDLGYGAGVAEVVAAKPKVLNKILSKTKIV